MIPDPSHQTNVVVGFTDARDRPFFVKRLRLRDGVLLSLRGELDLTTASLAEDELVKAQQSYQLVVLDLRTLSFMDSTGLGLIVSAQRRARASGHRFVMVQGPPQIQRVLELTGLTTWMEVIANPSSLSDQAGGRPASTAATTPPDVSQPARPDSDAPLNLLSEGDDHDPCRLP